MADNLKPVDRRKAMFSVKGKSTSLERRFFSTLAGMHLKGWKKNAAELIGKPDVIFEKERLTIFIDGCFWHGCPRCCKKLPQTNRLYWSRKINRNVAFAKSANRRLREDGWLVIRIWEHEIRNPRSMKKIKIKIKQALNQEPKADGRKGRRHQKRGS